MFMHTIVFVHKTVNQCKQNFLDIIYTKSQCCIYLTALGDLPQLQLSCITRFTKVFNVIPYPETLCHSKFELKICLKPWNTNTQEHSNIYRNDFFPLTYEPYISELA